MEYHGELTGETAVTLAPDLETGLNRKYRAVDEFSHDLGKIALFGEVISEEMKEKKAFILAPPTRTVVAACNMFDIKCPEKPNFISINTSFYCNENDFNVVKNRIEEALNGLEDYDWSYFAKEIHWRVKYLHGSHLREKYIYCYWDSKKEDHIVEVKRVRGDGLNNASSSLMLFFSKLKAAVTSEDGNQEELSHTKRCRLSGPLPVPTTMQPKTVATSSFPPLPKLSRERSGSTFSMKLLPVTGFTPQQISIEQFLAGVKPLLSMVHDQFYETRLEASKLLCDLATKEKKFLELAETQSICFESLDVLLLDEFEDIRQFAVIAFALFTELPQYQMLFVNLRAIDALITLISPCPFSEPSYITAQMRRQAAIGMSRIALAFSSKMVEHLKFCGYSIQQMWLDHCATILDKRTRDAAMKMASCYV